MIKVPSHGETIKGFDVSHYQSNFDFQKARIDGNAFCFLKATEGVSYVDKAFHSHWAKAKSAGLLVGAYHFFHPKQDPEDQAEHFAKTVGSLSADDLPCVLDWETTDNVPSDTDRLRALAFLERIHTLTKKNPIIYMSPYFGQSISLTVEFSHYPLWIAHYGTSAPLIPLPWKYWTFWQYSEHETDHNLFNGGMEQLRRLTLANPI